MKPSERIGQIQKELYANPELKAFGFAYLRHEALERYLDEQYESKNPFFKGIDEAYKELKIGGNAEQGMQEAKVLIGNLYGQPIYLEINDDIKDSQRRKVIVSKIHEWFLNADLALREKNFEKGIE